MFFSAIIDCVDIRVVKTARFL